MTLPTGPTVESASPAWRNRIVGEGEEDPCDLIPNFANGRRHPSAQAAAMTGALDELGWACYLSIFYALTPDAIELGLNAALPAEVRDHGR